MKEVKFKKVRDLISELQKYDQEMIVLTDGYEGGYLTPKICIFEVVLNYNVGHRSYEGGGPHDEYLDHEGKVCARHKDSIPTKILNVGRS